MEIDSNGFSYTYNPAFRLFARIEDSAILYIVIFIRQQIKFL